MFSLCASSYSLFPISFSQFVISSLKKEREAERRQTQNQPPRLRAARAQRSAHACRRSTTALTQGSTSSQRLGFRPGFLGRGLRGRYPPSPVPVQRCTSHPGHNAGRLIPKPPGSRLQIRPRAPHPLHLSVCLRKASFRRAGGMLVSKCERRSQALSRGGNASSV
jgi:hypothetical protein